MREEIEAAASFITGLVNKHLSQSNSANCSSAASTSSSASTSSASSTSSESPPGFPEIESASVSSDTSNIPPATDLGKVEQFRLCLTQALYERFHNHWFPEQPTKGQAYRCIRLNEWDRHDITLQKACLQCGIDYKDLQLPVELTLWVDPDEVTCRFGENIGSHCLVAKFKEGETKDNNSNIDINNIDIEIFKQQQRLQQKQQQQHHPMTTNSNITSSPMTNERMLRQSSFHSNSPDYHHKQQQNHLSHNNNSFNDNNHNSSYQFIHHNNTNRHQQQAQLQSSPHHQQHHHRSNLGKATVIPSNFPNHHHNYLNGCDTNGNPLYYYI